MWWTLIKYMLDKNGSSAWNRINNIISLYKMADSAQNSSKSTYPGAVTNDGMYGNYGG